MNIIAIDPGTIQSGFVIWDGTEILRKGKYKNTGILAWLRDFHDMSIYDPGTALVIEEINPYTMGMTIRDTILWSGRFQEAWEYREHQVDYIPRRDVTKHLCGAGSGIGDSAVCAALRDRFAYGVRNYGKGIKAEPGFFHGFKSDIWAAFALAVTWWDNNQTD